MKTICTLAACAAWLLLVVGAQAAEELKVGDDAPDFTLKASDGKSYKLSNFKGKQTVVVAWFPRAFTPGCTKECKNMAAERRKIREFDVAYFAASTDPVDTNKKFAESLSADYPILCDTDGTVSTTYGIYNPERKAAKRVTFYVDKDGKIAFIDSAVKTDTHGADIAAKLKELGVAAKK